MAFPSDFKGTVSVCNLARDQSLQTLEGHADHVLGVAFSPDGSRLASTSKDNKVIIWDVLGSKQIRSLIGHDAWVVSAAFSPDGTRLASAGYDRTVRLWDLGAGRELHTLRGHRARVHRTAFSQDGARVASWSEDGVIKLWDVTTGQEVRSLDSRGYWVGSLSFSPDGRQLTAVTNHGPLLVWDATVLPAVDREARGLLDFLHSQANDKQVLVERIGKDSKDRTISEEVRQRAPGAFGRLFGEDSIEAAEAGTFLNAIGPGDRRLGHARRQGPRRHVGDYPPRRRLRRHRVARPVAGRAGCAVSAGLG